MSTLSAHIVGLGRIAWRGFGKPGIETHVSTLLEHPRFTLASAWDIERGVRDSFRGTAPIVIDGAWGADVLVVCTPPETHLPVVREWIENRPVRGILCEKPLASTVEDAEEIVRLCDDAKVTLLVGHQRRYDRRHLALRNFLADGNLGRVVDITAFFSGGYLNNGSHAADICRFIDVRGDGWQICQGKEFRIDIEGSLGHVVLRSDGVLAPGYMKAMYDDLADCLDDPLLSPTCTGRDGVEAVRHALAAEARHAA